MNQIVLMGRLTRDPELRHTQSGTPVASFSLAVDRGYVSKENGERQTDFIDIVAWRSTAEFVSKYFTKGQMAAVTGRLQLRDWTDKDGNKRRSAEVVADNIYFTESKRSREASVAAGGGAPGRSIPYSEPQNSYGDGYSTPVAPSNFEELEEDDGELPF
jgi:single-strand DNA-binding protein